MTGIFSLSYPKSATPPLEGEFCDFKRKVNSYHESAMPNYRRIDQLRAIALDCGFGNEDAKDFGKLSKTATWEAMLETYGVPFPADNSSLDTEDTEHTEESD